MTIRRLLLFSIFFSFFGLLAFPRSVAAADSPTLTLRAAGVPTGFGIGPVAQAQRQMIDAFRAKYPNVDPVATTGIHLPGYKSMDMVPFMQIAGDIAPDVMYVNFRQSQTYISMKLLYPLDKYIERGAGVSISDFSALDNDAALAALAKGPGWSAMHGRELALTWPVIRRLCPYGDKCPYRKADQLAPLARHYHIWTMPVGPLATAMQFDRSLLAEHVNEGIELRTPHDWNELMAWSKLLTDPKNNTYGLGISASTPGWTFANFLYAAGGKVVEQDKAGNWYCVLDSEDAVKAAYYFARLRLEKVYRNGQFITRGVIKASEAGTTGGPVRFGFKFTYLDDQFFSAATDQTQGLGPVPAGPTGLRRGELNASMMGIFSGLADNQPLRDAAWHYIQFYDGTESRRIRTETMVEAGLGPYVRRDLLEQFNVGGRYDSVIRRIPPGLEDIYTVAFANGVPEPYGKNCQYVYDELNKPIGAIWASPTIVAAIDAGDEAAAKAEIRGILKRATQRINQKMLGNLSPAQTAHRNTVATIVIFLVLLTFTAVMWSVMRTFTPPELRKPRRRLLQLLRPPGGWGQYVPLASRMRGALSAPHADRLLRSDTLATATAVGVGPSAEAAGAIRPWVRALANHPADTSSVLSSEASASPPLAESESPRPLNGWRKNRYLKAWLIMAPALLLITIWIYWPMIKGTAIAFQDYSVLGDSQWVGAANFAQVLYSGEFWYSLRVSLWYALLFFFFGFWAPIGLAFLLSEVPRGGIFFRTVYYLPAVLSGVVVIFLWKSFYGPSGMINQLLNEGVWLLNLLPGVALGTFNSDWLQDPRFAIFFCLLPTIWAGMGPGCLIYLAALKTIPEDLYEAADIDGAGIRHKLFHVALPTIKILVMINFIGAMIGAVRGAGGFMLAMTGGGPYGETGGATEVIGLKIFYTTFGYLQFGVGAAMAWILGAMLIGFTVIQLRQLSNLEFRTAKL